MGLMHFKQMQAAALLVDCKAIPYAFSRFREAVLAEEADSSDIARMWCQMPFDSVVECSRQLLDVDARYINALQELMSIRKIVARVADPTGMMHDVRDPDVLIYDDPRITDPATLCYLVLGDPAKLVKEMESHFRK